MARIDPEVGAEAVAAVRRGLPSGTSVRVSQLARPPARRARRRQTVLVEDVRRAGRQDRLVPDVGDDDAGVDLEAGGMGLRDDLAQRVEAAVEGDAVGRRLDAS